MTIGIAGFNNHLKVGRSVTLRQMVTVILVVSSWYISGNQRSGVGQDGSCRQSQGGLLHLLRVEAFGDPFCKARLKASEQGGHEVWGKDLRPRRGHVAPGISVFGAWGSPGAGLAGGDQGTGNSRPGVGDWGFGNRPPSPAAVWSRGAEEPLGKGWHKENRGPPPVGCRARPVRAPRPAALPAPGAGRRVQARPGPGRGASPLAMGTGAGQAGPAQAPPGRTGPARSRGGPQGLGACGGSWRSARSVPIVCSSGTSPPAAVRSVRNPPAGRAQAPALQALIRGRGCTPRIPA